MEAPKYIRSFSCGTGWISWRHGKYPSSRPRAAVGLEMDSGEGESEGQGKQGSQQPAGGTAGQSVCAYSCRAAPTTSAEVNLKELKDVL